MKQYTATKQTTITTGRVKMEKPQAFHRSGHLIPVPGKPGVYDIRDFIVLAEGETVLIDPLPVTVEPVPVKPKKKATKK